MATYTKLRIVTLVCVHPFLPGNFVVIRGRQSDFIETCFKCFDHFRYFENSVLKFIVLLVFISFTYNHFYFYVITVFPKNYFNFYKF